MKKVLILFLSLSLLFVNDAFARRFGSGRNYGMQRNTAPSQSYNRQSNYIPPTQNPQPTQRSGMNPVAAGAIGAAAGAAGGYMLGRSMANNNNNVEQANASGVQSTTTAPQQASRESQIPWGAIILLLGILALGLVFFRKKISPDFNTNNSANNNPINPNNFATQNTTRPIVSNRFTNMMNRNSPEISPISMNKMPDGIETVYFLRQVKGMFLHIQSMNNADNIEEIRKYMVAELFEDIKSDVASNPNIADFANLNCQLIECMPQSAMNTSTASDSSGNPIPLAIKPWDMQEPLIASVKFFGTVSEDPKEEPIPFAETWNFVKSADTNGKWLVAGIQQDTQQQTT